MKYIAFDLIENEIELFKTETDAKKRAEDNLDYYQENAPDDGWPEAIEGAVGYAEIKEASTITKTIKKGDPEAPDDWSWDFDEICYVGLKEK